MRLILLFLFTIYPTAFAQNLGHRLGGDIYPPENTIYSLKQAITHLQDKPDFIYAELDIRESKDGELIVFHDEKIMGEVKTTAVNRSVIAKHLPNTRFEHVKLSDLTLTQIKELRLPNDQQIPTLLEIYEHAHELGLSKPLMVEIKELKSDKARSQLLKIAKDFDGKVSTMFMAFNGHFQNSFPDKHRWGVMFKRAGYAMYTPKKPKNSEHDHFANIPADSLNWNYQTTLERSVYFKNEATRAEKIRVTAPHDKVPHKLRLGVQHGYDDSGDKKSQLKVTTHDNQILLNKSIGSKGWEWFEIHNSTGDDLFIEYSDSDTKFSGKHPGNGTFINITMGTRDEVVLNR